MNIEHQGRRIRKELRVNVEPERVFRAWADPEEIARWFVDRAEGDQTAGGQISWIFDTFGMKQTFEVLVAEPGVRYVLHWKNPEGPPGHIEVQLAPDGNGTRILFVNSGFSDDGSWDEQYEGVDRGWDAALRILKEYLERHAGKAKRSVLAAREAAFDYPDLAPWFTEETSLRTWLTTAGSTGIGDIGESVRLELRHIGPVHGEVLVRTVPEILVRWEEIEGVLALKAYRDNKGQRVAALMATSWNLSDARAAQLETGFGAALERLQGQLSG